jgi:hypothetical protein
MQATTLKELLNTIKSWYETDIPQSRTIGLDANGRNWFLDSIGWDKTLKLKDLRKATDRKELNSDYVTKFKETDPKAKKGVSAIKLEISQLHSFNKCFVQRYKSRLQYYKDDLSQKSSRTLYNVGQSMAIFTEFKQNLES